MNRPRLRQIQHRVMILCSFLPNFVITLMLKLFPGKVKAPNWDGWGFWLDASYWKYCRMDKRRSAAREF